MQTPQRSRFVEMAGHVVIDSLHLPSLGTGLLLSVPVLLAVFFAAKVQSGTLTLVSLAALFPLTLYVLSRLALNGLGGDSMGGVFSQSGGSFEDLMPVFGRFISLTLVWALPAVIMFGFYEPKLRNSFAAPFRMGAPEPPPVILTLYLGTGFFVGFLLLTVSVAATKFTDAFSLGFWAALFQGRSGEVFLMLAASVGAPVAVFLLAAPWLSALGQKSQGFAAFLAGVLIIYLVGVHVSIHGKLCGFFASAVMSGTLSEGVGPAPPAPASASPPSGKEPEPTVTIPGRDEEIRQAWVLFAQRRSAAIERLEILIAQFAPDGRVLHALAMMHLQSQDSVRAAEAARGALPLCAAAGDFKQVKELYAAFSSQVQGWGYDHTQLAAIGDALAQAGDMMQAANAFAFSLHADATDARAFKGLLKCASHLAQKGEAPDRALKIYEFLIARAPGSPFVEHARTELTVLKKRLSKT